MKAGVIVEFAGRRYFVDAERAVAVVEAPRLAPVPGVALWLLWFEGQVLAAVPFEACQSGEPSGTSDAAPGAGQEAGSRPPSGVRRGPALICEVEAGRYGVFGLEVVASGRFEAAPSGGVRYGTDEVPEHALEPPGCLFGAPSMSGPAESYSAQTNSALPAPAERAPAEPFRGTLFDGGASEPEDTRGSEEANGE